MPGKKGTLRIGTSGYIYDHWKGTFYPDDLPKKNWFDYYAEQFDSVEINNTFYNLPADDTFDDWHDRAPDGFRYALKFSRYGTHMKKLKNPEDPIEKFLDRAERLKSYLGPVLVQLPPNWRPNLERLEGFLKAAPKRVRWAFEFREKEWFTDEVFDLLDEHDAALCVHDMLGSHPEFITAEWTYWRFHGDHYTGSYSTQELTAIARKFQKILDTGKDVYAYFNNDEEGYAPKNALDLRRYIES